MAETLLAVSSPRAGPETAEPEAPSEALLAGLLVVFRDEDVDRFNAEDHQALLDRLAVELPELAPLPPRTPADLGDRVDSLADDFVAERLARALVEMLGRHGPWDGSDALLSRLENLFRLFLTRERLDESAEIADTIRALSEDPHLTPEARGALQDSLGRLASLEVLATLVESLSSLSEQSVAATRRLIERLGSGAVQNLLRALIEEPSRSRRRRIFDLLGSLGPVVVNDATQWLADSRWYVVRNMVLLLRAVGDRSSLQEIRRCALHPNPRVRLEALRSLLTLDAHAPRDTLERGINDPDPTVVEGVITLAGERGIAESVDPLVALLAKWDPFGRRRSIRLSALGALGQLADPAALPRLGRFFRDWLVPIVAIEERRAAFECLASYPEPARRPLVQKGLTSRDLAICEICRRLAGRP